MNAPMKRRLKHKFEVTSQNGNVCRNECSDEEETETPHKEQSGGQICRRNECSDEEETETRRRSASAVDSRRSRNECSDEEETETDGEGMPSPSRMLSQ